MAARASCGGVAGREGQGRVRRSGELARAPEEERGYIAVQPSNNQVRITDHAAGARGIPGTGSRQLGHGSCSARVRTGLALRRTLVAGFPPYQQFFWTPAAMSAHNTRFRQGCTVEEASSQGTDARSRICGVTMHGIRSSLRVGAGWGADRVVTAGRGLTISACGHTTASGTPRSNPAGRDWPKRASTARTTQPAENHERIGSSVARDHHARRRPPRRCCIAHPIAHPLRGSCCVGGRWAWPRRRARPVAGSASRTQQPQQEDGARWFAAPA